MNLTSGTVVICECSAPCDEVRSFEITLRSVVRLVTRGSRDGASCVASNLTGAVEGSRRPTLEARFGSQASPYRALLEPGFEGPRYEVSTQSDDARQQLWAVSCTTLLVTLDIQGKYDGAEVNYRRSIEIQEKTFGPDHAGLGISLANRANVHSKQVREHSDHR